jgi:hypothetical protein
MRALISVLLLWASSADAETCRYAGATSRGGRAEVIATVSRDGDALWVDVALSFRVSLWFSDVQVLWEEITNWRRGEVQLLAVNGRTIVDGEARRQQWDVFLRQGGALQAYRVQAKRLADFRQRHPGFVRHWAPASFGQPWLSDYMAAPPERRPDLDLAAAAAAPGLRTPLALAFYWSRFLPVQGGATPVFLPGFKHNARTQIAFAVPAQGEGWRRWEAPLRHPELDSRPASSASAWVSADNYLLQLGIDVHTRWASGQAMIRAQGCQGVQLRPD